VVPQAVPNPEEDPEEAKKKARRLKIIFICVLIVTLCIISASIF
jgi:flagellar basal body-associated protein FliL